MSRERFHLTLAQAAPNAAAGGHRWQCIPVPAAKSRAIPGIAFAECATECARNHDRRGDAQHGDSRADRGARTAVQRSEAQPVDRFRLARAGLCQVSIRPLPQRASERVRPRALKTSRNCTTRRSPLLFVSRRLRLTVRDTPMGSPSNVRGRGAQTHIHGFGCLRNGNRKQYLLRCRSLGARRASTLRRERPHAGESEALSSAAARKIRRSLCRCSVARP